MRGVKHKIILLLFGVGACATMYYNGMNNMRAKYIAMGCFGILFAMAFIEWNQISYRPKIFGTWLKCFLAACTINIFYGIDPTNQDIALPLIVAFSSYCLLDIPRDKVSYYLLPICIFSAYCALSSVLSGLGSFTLGEFDDNEIVKNQIGAAFTVIAIICAVLAMDKKTKWLTTVYVIISLLNIYPAIFFSCRTALLCYSLIVCYIIFASYGYKGIMVLPVVILAIVLLGGSDLQILLYESVIGNRDSSNIDNLTSGRLTHASIAYNYFLKHPFLGYYGSGDYSLTARAHIYLLRRLSEWGLIGVLPFFVLYFSIFKLFIRSFKLGTILLAALLMLAMIESFSEYAPPFGPGSSFLMMFIIIGYYLRLEPSLSNYK